MKVMSANAVLQNVKQDTLYNLTPLTSIQSELTSSIVP